ncbi:anthranilate synthase component I family protein [Pseudomonadota bacterium]
MTFQIAKLNIKDPLKCLSILRGFYDNCFLLESAVHGDLRLSRYSFIGFDPETFIEIKGNEVKINNQKSKLDDPFKLLSKYIEKYRCSSFFPYSGGLVGNISYDSIRYIEKIPNSCKDDLKLPDMQFGHYTDGIVFDRFAKTTYYFSLKNFRLHEIEKKLYKDIEINNGCQIQNITPNITKKQYEQNVIKAKEYLRKGEILQVVLSQRFDIESKTDPLVFYQHLRELNPSPYMFFLDFPVKIIGASPESSVRIMDRQIEVNPIAGTRPIGKTYEENIKLKQELQLDTKEQAEHMMLVDLARNDVGRVAQYGSINITDFKKVEQYSHVQHLVSRITGKLRNDKSNIDGFKATFPAGTVTGAPKIRAMKIIDNLETTRRGPYAGCVGYFSANGDMDFAIAIRTAMKKKKYHIQAGAGIVIDSKPENEYHECKQKAKALRIALGGAE